MATYTLPYRVVYSDGGLIICVIRGDIPKTHTTANCAQFATEAELDAFIAAQGLTPAEEWTA